MSDNSQNRIDAYLRGEMTAEQRLEFEKDLNDDAKLREDLRLTKEITEALTERQQKIAMISKWEKEAEISERLANHRLTLKRWTIGLSAAACIAIGFFAVKPLFMTNSGRDFAMPSFDGSYMRSSSGFVRVDSLIGAKSYDLALRNVDSLYSVGASLLREYADQDSLSERDAYKMDLLKSDQYELSWRRINLLMATGEKEQATKELKAFVDIDGPHKAEAQSLLKSLK